MHLSCWYWICKISSTSLRWAAAGNSEYQILRKSMDLFGISKGPARTAYSRQSVLHSMSFQEHYLVTTVCHLSSAPLLPAKFVACFVPAEWTEWQHCRSRVFTDVHACRRTLNTFAMPADVKASGNVEAKLHAFLTYTVSKWMARHQLRPFNP